MNISAAVWQPTGISASINEGEMFGVQIQDHQIAIYNVDGKIYATDNICTHAYAILTDGWLDGPFVECPLHGGRFDVTTGQAQGDPVTCDLRIYETRIVDDKIEVLI